jgi:hypothetical protein
MESYVNIYTAYSNRTELNLESMEAVYRDKDRFKAFDFFRYARPRLRLEKKRQRCRYKKIYLKDQDWVFHRIKLESA